MLADVRHFTLALEERDMKILKAIGDRILGSLAPSAKAGACVPEHGDRCCKKYGVVQCLGNCL
jgi:hypothetical protein